MQRFASLLCASLILGAVAGKERDFDRADLPKCALAHKLFKADKAKGLYKVK